MARTRRFLILSGIPGKMSRSIAGLLNEEAWGGQFALAPFGLGASGRAGTTVDLEMVRPLKCESAENLSDLMPLYGVAEPIVIDFSTPNSALLNIREYVRSGVSFVMGTTGFDRNEAEYLVRGSGVSAVIAPNMAIPIVMLQEALAWAAENYEGALNGYTFTVTESHQSAKKDKSGTAKALLPRFNRLGGKLHEGDIVSIRDAAEQKKLGVPEDAISGHGWHWYEATSPTGDVELTLSHKVNGRRVYAEGTLLAARFLSKMLDTPERGIVYTMKDVLKGLRREG